MALQNQFLVFCLCVCVGFCGGIVYEPFACVRVGFRCGRGKCKPLAVVLDLLYALAFGTLCIFSAYALRFPEFRVYMCIGYALGGGIYLKTLRKVFAFLQNMCYNVVVKVYKKSKKKEKKHKIRKEKV